MTPKYWAGIFACMLAIFAIGMVVTKGVAKGKDFVENASTTMNLRNASFRVDGSKVGSIDRWQFLRSQPGQVDSAVLTVTLKDDADSTDFDANSCILRATSAQPFGNDTRFRCVTSDDSAKLNLVRFGHVELMPSGVSIPMFVAGERAEDTRLHAYRGAGSNDSGDVDINTTDGHLSITVNGRSIVEASGDSTGGSLVVRDPKTGKPIVQISGDSNGSFKVMDANGKTRVNIHGSNKKDSNPH